MIHRYSEEFKSILHQRNQHVPTDWPEQGSREYHERLLAHDRHRLANRRLASSNGSYYLAPSNETAEEDNLGALHYSLITIGNPNLTFLVALDTGSDLFWIPCDCQQCAPTSESSYGFTNGVFSVYSPSNSQSSKVIPCSDGLCTSTIAPSNCTSASQSCNYVVNYLSANTSTSGVIVQDMLHLGSENQGGGAISTPIYFGCGMVQTGDLANGSVAPNGLLGLGPDDISVPSTLARNGIVPNSFSMCFSAIDLSGRLVFGNKGNATLPNTSFVSIQPNVYYVLNADNAVVDNQMVALSQNLVFDTGTSFTLMPQSTLQAIGAMLNQKITLTSSTLNNIFDYCWGVSDSNQLNNLPNFTISFSGGSTLVIQTPYVVFGDSAGNPLEVCLGIVGGGSLGIIGHNFMAGYEFFIDKDSNTLSWSSSNCYDSNGTVNSIGISPQVAPASDKGAISTTSPTQATSSTTNKVNSLSLQFLFFIICISIIWM